MTPPFRTSVAPRRRSAIGGGTHADAGSPQAATRWHWAFSTCSVGRAVPKASSHRWRCAMTTPARQPGARPPRRSGIEPTSSPLRAIGHEIAELGFRVSSVVAAWATTMHRAARASASGPKMKSPSGSARRSWEPRRSPSRPRRTTFPSEQGRCAAEHDQRRRYIDDDGDRACGPLAGREMRAFATPGGVPPRSAGGERGLKDGNKGEADCDEHCRQTGHTIASGDEVHLTSLSLKLRNGAREAGVPGAVRR